ncbi:hypothetical protein HK104_009454, partial [Borealophlyctis nickersoniae]
MILPDLLDTHNHTWKTYQESYPGSCFTGTSHRSLYYRKHNPFMSFSSVTGNKTGCERVVDATELETDVKGGKVPEYLFYVPDVRDGGGDTGVGGASTWLETFLEPKLTDTLFFNNTL